MPWVPPYFGTWEQLVNELLHNPFLGSGRGGYPPCVQTNILRMADPDPVPWYVNVGGI